MVISRGCTEIRRGHLELQALNEIDSLPPSGRASRDVSRGACDDHGAYARAYGARRVYVSVRRKGMRN